MRGIVGRRGVGYRASVLRRLLLVAIAALALASPAAAFSKQDGMQTMDDGVSIAFTRYTPDGADAERAAGPACSCCTGSAATAARSTRSPPRSRRPATRCSPTTRAATASPAAWSRWPARARSPTCARCARRSPPATDVHDTKIGAWGISYGGGQIWNALVAGVPFAAVEVVETWTSLYGALWPQDLARSGIVAGFAASIAARSPLVAGIRDDAVQSTNLAAVRALAAGRSVIPRLGGLRSITTPGLPVPGPDRLRVRHHPGVAGLRRPRRPEEALHRQLRPPRPRRSRAQTCSTCSRSRSPGTTGI